MAGTQSPSEEDVRVLNQQVQAVVDLRASVWCCFLRSAPAQSLGNTVRSVVGARNDDHAVAVVQRTATPGWVHVEQFRVGVDQPPHARSRSRSFCPCVSMFCAMFFVPVFKCSCFALTVVECT